MNPDTQLTPQLVLRRLRAWIVDFAQPQTFTPLPGLCGRYGLVKHEIAEIQRMELIFVWDPDKKELSLIDLLEPGKSAVIIDSYTRLEFVCFCLAFAQAKACSIRTR